MSPKIILFAGAPDPNSIDWTSADLLTDFTAPISTFLGIPSLAHDHGPVKGTHASNYRSCSSTRKVSWRSLPLERPHLETGHSHLHALPNLFVTPNDVKFCSTASLSFSIESTRDDPEVQDGSVASQEQQRQTLLSRFYDHSLACHQDIASSQLPPASPSLDDTTKTTSLFRNSKSFSSIGEDHPSSLSSARPPLGNPSASTHLSDLEDIPSARHLLSLAPQTVTVNLIAGVISIAAPRTVVTRWGTRMSLVEVLLGDETRAGFAVTFWLPAAAPSADTAPVRQRTAEKQEPELLADGLSKLRTQDVVLLQNVALNVFRGRVYGQSLRKGLTKLYLLHRRRLDPGDEEGYYCARDFARARPDERGSHPQFEKTRRVRDWVLRFVRAGQTDTSGEKGPRTTAGKKRKGWEMPPDDTQ
ncbi:hypothetical protein SODALDRAFT_335716 [Sodiomyces alkalinus F11]|uniref:Nucleic acid-binding protein n=1 Tax=Sodiomyces alkalinus (strain CBS 110278 / VKM F-3762 / F11) TaxID=1314773 RepID=A0A3N2PQ43_SODAK|nr:hypothetical protein SODALDRAFT_335716 [Sodiomyces alkalinus F11]ROT36615.1 hypothetical protein SODALDRAFT_335716 [Sodiomyces alkalinus F11]